MKRVILLATALAALSATGSAGATEVGTSRPFGLGVQVLEPTALIGKLFLDRNDAVDFGIGFWDYGRCYDHGNGVFCDTYHQVVSLHFDYLYEENILDREVRLDWHVGAGGRLRVGDYAYYDNNRWHSGALFARVPIGLDLAFRRPSWLEVYLEVAPGLWIYPPLYFDIDVGLGVRAYF